MTADIRIASILIALRGSVLEKPGDDFMKSLLVSILIPAYNAEKTIGDTIKSAINQSWKFKEIIVVDDGSKDRTAEVARGFGSAIILVSTKNQGAAMARNEALRLSKGDYIQWLDADDILAPDKIERQLAALGDHDDRRILLSSSWASFYYRTRNAHFLQTSLCQHLTPVEWMLRKMNENLHMQTATWLTSRELVEAAGPWDTRLKSDDDGEYFCRVLMASEKTHFVEGTGVYYRVTPSTRLSHIGGSNSKKDALFISMKLHVQYLLSLEDSERTKKACVRYIQTWYPMFYPDRADIVRELQVLAEKLGGTLVEPRFRWKFAWIKPLFGWRAASWAQSELPHWKASCIRLFDKTMYKFEIRWGGDARRAAQFRHNVKRPNNTLETDA